MIILGYEWLFWVPVRVSDLQDLWAFSLIFIFKGCVRTLVWAGTVRDLLYSNKSVEV